MTETAKPGAQMHSSKKPKPFDERAKDGKLAKNSGRIQFRAVANIIDRMLQQGYDLKKTHNELYKHGKITMSYQTFCYQAASHNEQKNIRKAGNNAQTSKAILTARNDISKRKFIPPNNNPNSKEVI
ncbi:MAG: TraK family protein [Desulfarculales bacterium]|jgi:hypothetical protein|nr:TraK family protein [Desulfarculales bacterium]